MFKLRQTWSAILPNQKLYMIDVKIHKMLDPAWPITAKPDKTNMHVNPKFLHVSISNIVYTVSLFIYKLIQLQKFLRIVHLGNKFPEVVLILVAGAHRLKIFEDCFGTLGFYQKHLRDQ